MYFIKGKKWHNLKDLHIFFTVSGSELNSNLVERDNSQINNNLYILYIQIESTQKYIFKHVVFPMRFWHNFDSIPPITRII